MATKRITATPQRTDFDFDDFLAAGYRVRQAPPVQEQTPPESEKRTWGQAIGDTAVQMAEGVNTTLGAVPSIVAPDGAIAGFFRDNADYWRDKQSEVLKQRIAATDQRIQEAGKEGVMSQIGTAVSEYWNDPAQAARLVATNLPSMAATLGTGALAGAAAKGVAAARGLDAANKAALAAQYGTRTAMATNAALNAGGARGEAYEDLKRTALAQGMSQEQAEQAALDGSILPGVVGGVAGAISGKLGLEKALLGQPGAGAGTALRRSAGAFGAELAGEQIEEVAPKITTNYEAGKIDPARSLTDDLGRTMVETTIGAGPGALVAGGVEGMSTPAKEAADTIRATEKVPESGALTKAVNAGVEAKAQAVEAGAPVPTQTGAEQVPEAAPEAVDDPVRDQILALPEGARQDALRAYAVVNRTDVAKGVQQYNRKLLDRLLAENAPPPVLGERLTDTDMGSMLGGGGMAGRTDPLAGALGMNNEAQAAAITNVANVAERRPPMPASDAARMLDEARNRGLDLAVAEHPAGGFVLVPPQWVTPDMAAQGEARLNETIARMQQADAAPVDRAPRTRTDGVGLDLQTDPVQNYLDNLRTVNTPAARAYVRDFDAGRITPADVQQRMQAEQGLTPEQRIARAASEAPAQTDPVADRLRQAVSQRATPAPTDILNPAGEPFKTRMAADRAAKKTPGAVVPVEGGFVVRPQESVNVQDVPQAPEVPQAAPAISQPGQAPQAVGAQPAGPAAGVPTEGAGSVEAAGVTDAPTMASSPEGVADDGRGLEADAGNDTAAAGTVPATGDPITAEPEPAQPGGDMLGALDGRPGATGAPTGDVAGPKAPAVGAPLDALQNQAVAPESQAQAATKGVANQPITRAQVDSAVQQASSAVGARIDAMSAQEVQKIAARFLPTMGVRVPAGKARIKEAVTSAGPRMNWAAAAAEFGAELSQDAMSALQADVEGRVQERAGPAMPSAVAEISPAPATHADPGQAPEVVTPAVAAQSVQKAARNEDTKPSEMRKWLVGKIDEAIAVAPEAAVDFLSFDVPGDGTFKVQNSQARLQEFRKKVLASPGFKDGGQKQNTNPPDQVDSARNGSGSTMEAIRNFLADGDVEGAMKFAKLKGVEFTPVPPQMKMSANGKGKVKHMPASVKSSVPSVAEGLTQVEAEQLNQYLTAESARKEPAATQDADVQPSPQDFIPAPDGGLDYGEITPEMGKAMRRQAGKIRLQHGVQNSNGTGWGLVHIEANHGKQISGLGFGSVQDFVAHVASSIQQVWQVPGNSQLLLTLKDGRKDVMYIQLEIAKEGDFYRVNSAFPVRQEDYESLKGMKKIWDGSEPTSAVTGQRPAFATAASASPESESSQGSSNARGQDASVPPTAPAAQPDTPKLTPAEAKALMAWEDLGQKDGVKTHALTFYESQADKDAKRGRMIVAKVSKGDRSATAWMVDGEDKAFGALAQAKKRAEEVGMAKAVADGFVEQGATKPTAAAKPAATATTSAPIEDAGEKIGGARKDRWKERGLNLDDLDAMTEAEGAELATKANVWKPDYEALSEASEPVTAAMVKAIYDQLAAKPKKNTPEGRRQYVQMMRIVRDVLTEAKGPEAVRNAYLEIRNRAGLNTKDPQAKAAARELLFSVYKGRSDPFVLDGGDLMKVKKMVDDGFPAKAAPWKTRLTVGRREGGSGTTERGIEIYMERSAEVGTPLTREQILDGFYRVSTKDNKTVAFAASKADAEAAAATVYERDMKGKKDGKPEPVRPNLDELKRENLPQRIDRDVTSEDFVRDLGFRGVEFGNWSAQDERQRILNMAYDGLMDLAEIMGVPPKAMSLNGTLGMAFGARGGGRFMAHYEPGKLVINMTKIRGGGSMAHEWAHAMDHYFGELDKADAYTTKARGASGWHTEEQYKGLPRKRMERVGNEWKSVEKMRLDNLRPEMAAAFDEVMRALFQKQITKAEMVRSHELDLERTEALAAKEQDADMKAMYTNMAENKRQALEELRQDPEDRMYDGRGRSDYASQAQELSGKSENGYWTRPTEMFARAFESWVFDKVTAMGARSDYLVHGVEEDRFAGGGYKGNPYPTGEERARINAAFDKLAQTIKTKETDKGVAMFRSIRTAKSAQTKLSQDAVEKAVASALNRVVGAPKVQVVAAPADAGIDVPPGVIPKGVTLPDGSVLIFSDSAESVLDVFQTVFHELYHRGSKVRFTSNPDYITKMLEIASKDELVQQEVNAWKNTADSKDKWAEFQERGPMTGERLANFEALAVEEALATMAEKVAMGEVRKPETVIKQMARFIAKVANAWGMNRFALWLNTRSLAESEKFIIETIGMSGGKANEFTNSVLFRSKAEDISARVGDTLKSITVSNIKQRAGFKLTDYLGIGLQALGRRQIVDIYGDLVPLAEYNRLVQQMEADKNEGGAEADQLVTRWAKLQDEAKLADLMHDATLAQIDPDKDYVDGDDKGKFLMLERKFTLLSDKAKAVYRDTRDAYKAHHAKVRSAIKERIERSEIKGERKAALLKQMDDEFFKAVKGVYFPLARFGQYAVTVKGPDGKVESVSRAETKAEAEALRNNLLTAFPRDKGFTVGRVMLSKDFIADRDAVGRGFMTELYQVLDKQDMDAAQRAELEDTLGQLYLSSLPDLSWAKHGIHRKGTPGFSQDARRAFAQNMFHGARYLAKLRYSDLMQDELSSMQKHVDDWREVEDFDQNSAQRVVTEMYHRHESLMNPKSNALSTALTSLGFVFHLGLSPASAMVNLSQTALVAYPIMGAKWGFGKASAALLKASAEAAKGKNDITASLNADERAAYDEAVRAGTIDVTMAHDLAGIAQGEDAGVMWKIRPVMRWASFMFHHAERFNRQVTFVAAYRLAREAGADHKAAFEQATKATYDGHFDYGAANRPRVMQGNVAKVLLLFKQYGQNMVYTLARNAQQSIKGESPEVRAQARKALGGLLATHAAAAGVLGLPMVTTLLAAASMIGGDDDEPWDAKVALQNMLADTFGQKPAEVLAHGLSRLTPWDISGRVGLDKLIFPDVQEGLEGQRLWESAATQALGPVGGIFGGALKGLDLISDGHYHMGLEAMLPAVLRQAVKSVRYAIDGAQDMSGVSIKDEVSTPAVVGQLLGFSPSEVRLAQEGKSAIYQQDKALAGRRQELLTKAARATMAKDAEARAEAMKEIQRFNQKNPTRRITPLNVLQSVRNRQKRIDQAEGGVYLPKNRRDAIQAGRFALAESE